MFLTHVCFGQNFVIHWVLENRVGILDLTKLKIKVSINPGKFIFDSDAENLSLGILALAMSISHSRSCALEGSEKTHHSSDTLKPADTDT